MNLAPVILFVYNRPKHTLKVLEALSANELADASELFIFADGPKENASPDDRRMIEQTRQVIRQRKWCAKVTIHEADQNKGLAASITDSVSEIVKAYERVIVLEDDIVTSPYFLRYMNEALERYSQEDRVMSIAGYFYPIEKKLSSSFFLCFDSSWGWATWQRAWRHYNPDTDALLEAVADQKEGINRFNFEGSFDFYQMLKSQQRGIIDSWSIRWYASIFLHKGLTLYPPVSFVQNIGNDGSGRHADNTAAYDTKFPRRYVAVFPDAAEEHVHARKYLSKYFRQLYKNTLIDKVVYKLRRMIQGSGQK
jgi:hypothetical protein